MAAVRVRGAQACCAVTGAATFLPWHVGAGLSGTRTVRGIDVDVGPFLLAVCIVTIGLVQLRWRPAWIGAGFAGAIAARQIFDPSDIGSPDPGFGLWIAASAAAAAAVLLVSDLLLGVSSGNAVGASTDTDHAAGGDTDESPRRGLSGPLGRRRPRQSQPR